MTLLPINTVVHRWLHVPYRLNVRHLHKPKRPRGAVLLLHGLGDTGDMWQPVIERLPDDLTILAVDLLGFGDSPRPAWEAYDAKAQVRSLLATCIRFRLQGPFIIAGHSLGALVAVEFAKRYPLLTKALLLCSPPIYKPPVEQAGLPRAEDMLRSIYLRAAEDPNILIRLYALGRATRMFPKTMVVNQENIQMLTASLRTSIINQTTIDDIVKIRKPIKVLYGLFDPLLIRGNITDLTKSSDFVTAQSVRAAHGVNAAYGKVIVESVESMLAAT